MDAAHTGAGLLPGRDGLLAEARAALHPGCGLLLTGPTGIGKSAVLDALVEQSRSTGVRVLRCGPVPAESALPHGCLADLLARVPAALRARHLPHPLPGPPVHPDDPREPHDRLALHTAVLGLLAELSVEAPLLLVLDGLQDVDPPSAALVAFLARRLPALGVTLAAAERTAPGEPARRNRLCPPAVREIEVPPLPEDAIEQLLTRRGTLPPAPELRLLHRLADGNPYYALELALATRNRRSAHRNPPAQPDPDPEPSEDLPVPRRLRAELLAPVRALPPGTRTALLLTAVAERPTLGLLRAAGLADPVADLAEPERLGLLTVSPHGALRLRHPLLGAALRADTRVQERLAVHAALAGAGLEPVARARHLALAHPHQDPQVAAALAEAAQVARRRGDTDAAHRLALLAAERTPGADPGRRHEHLLTAAAHAADAGRHPDARRAAHRVLAEADDPAQRVRARMLLLETVGQALDQAGNLIQGGLADAGTDPALLAPLHFWSAVRELLGGRTATAVAEADRAAALALDAGDRTVRVDALGLLATVHALRGDPVAAAGALDPALRLAEARQSDSLLRRLALAELDADQVPQARRRVTALLDRDAGPTGAEGVEDTLASLVALVRIQVRAGECRRALAGAERCADLLADAGTRSPLGAYAAALAESVGGSSERAAESAQSAVDGCATAGDRLFQVRALGVLGFALLLPGTAVGAAHAVEALQRARELGESMELGDPDTVRRLADLTEALVQLGESDEAAQVLAEARRLTDRWPNDWGPGARAALDRAEGLAQAASGRADQAAALLHRSIVRFRVLALPLELARTLIACGAAERRARHRTSARTALAQAEAISRAHHAEPLLARIRLETERLEPGERPGEAAELTASEHRVALLVAGGATNREAAAALFVSVKTVEGTLSRVYRKLGVRSRTALARAVAAAVSSADTGNTTGTGSSSGDMDVHVAFTRRARVTPLMGGVGRS